MAREEYLSALPRRILSCDITAMAIQTKIKPIYTTDTSLEPFPSSVTRISPTAPSSIDCQSKRYPRRPSHKYTPSIGEGRYKCTGWRSRIISGRRDACMIGFKEEAGCGHSRRVGSIASRRTTAMDLPSETFWSQLKSRNSFDISFLFSMATY